MIWLEEIAEAIKSEGATGVVSLVPPPLPAAHEVIANRKIATVELNKRTFTNKVFGKILLLANLSLPNTKILSFITECFS